MTPAVAPLRRAAGTDRQRRPLQGHRSQAALAGALCRSAIRWRDLDAFNPREQFHVPDGTWRKRAWFGCRDPRRVVQQKPTCRCSPPPSEPPRADQLAEARWWSSCTASAWGSPHSRLPTAWWTRQQPDRAVQRQPHRDGVDQAGQRRAIPLPRAIATRLSVGIRRRAVRSRRNRRQQRRRLSPARTPAAR